MRARIWFRRAAIAAALLIFAAPAFAQNSPIVERLPKDTKFLVLWHGTKSLESVSRSNPLLRLMGEPSAAPLMHYISSQFSESFEKNSKEVNLSKEDMDTLLTVVRENSGAIGSIDLPASKEAGASHDGSEKQSVTFIVFDVSGKQDVIGKIIAREKAAAPDGAMPEHFQVGSVSVTKRTKDGKASYDALVSHYVVSCEDLGVMKTLIARFGATEAPKESLLDSPGYRAVGHAMNQGGGVLEFYAAMPDLKEMAPKQGNSFQNDKFMRAMKADHIRAFGGSVQFNSNDTRLKFGVLGDTAAGGLFDAVGAGVPSFVTLPLAGPGSSYNVWRLNLSSFYQTVKAGLQASLSEEDFAKMNMGEAFAGVALGMTLDEALELFTGEFAFISKGSFDNKNNLLVAVTIEDPEKVNKAFETALPGRLHALPSSGTTKFMSISANAQGGEGSSDPPTQVGVEASAPSAAFVAIAPNMLLVAQDEKTLREAAERLGKGVPPTGGLATNPNFLDARGLLPGELSGFQFTDMTNVPWSKLVEEARKENATKAESGDHDAQGLSDALRQLDPAIFAEYLHIETSGCWKDSNGVYFETVIR
ncbi:MAG: hypothetical protein ACRD50_12580 [Candidatus Acidiferrales bacterium]